MTIAPGSFLPNRRSALPAAYTAKRAKAITARKWTVQGSRERAR
jgi:hypothetical protein